MLIGVISDTHDNEPAVEAALAVFRHHGVEKLIHCGDVVSPSTVDLFHGFSFWACTGNNDWPRELEPAVSRLGGSYARDLDVKIGDRRFFVSHGDREAPLRQAIDSGSYDYVLYGHSHRKSEARSGRTHIINPGALYRAPAYSIAIVAPHADRVEFHEIPR